MVLRRQLALVLGAIPVHTEKRCVFSLGYDFFIYRHTGVFDYNVRNAALRDTVSDGTLFNVALNTHGTTTFFIGP